LASWTTDWRKLPIGCVIDVPATSLENKTGSWRAMRPVINREKCTKCLLCWIFCPDNSIVRREDDSVEVDYDYCKGCGICANECPVKAIEMVEEG
jgi:pyruvate ferredoxin oxidoreductase delta subunit